MKLEELPESIRDQVKEAIIRGRKIEAVKIYREEKNCGLKEDIEAITKELQLTHPELKTKQGGWASVIIIGLLLGTAFSMKVLLG